MRSKIIKSFLCSSLLALAGGCTTIGRTLNPYEGDFRCAHVAPEGKCASTPEIYGEVVPGYKQEGAPPRTVEAKPGVACPECEAANKGGVLVAPPTEAPSLPTYTVGSTPAESSYREASLAKAAKLLKDPVTPIVIPPSVMRILILPRKGEDGELDMAQFTFIMVDKPRWAIGDYLSALPEE